ncbi:MAG: hypothetical protein A2X02_09665 [Bacteroidetes bacterium GWF2_29_10]|nr:MAG: hypothetical protein A2X02_09665 [Bacteroidetes bacterium GWF2_29_10]
MKNNLKYFLSFFVIIFIFSSCKKYDISPPMVTLNGAATMYINLNSSFGDPGITAKDDEDDNPTVSVTGAVDVTTAGAYTIKYVARDKNNNYANPIYRTVYVIIVPETMYGNWSVWETTGTTYSSDIDSPWKYYPEPIAKGGRFTFVNFASKNIPLNVDFNNILGTEIIIPNHAYNGLNIKGKGGISDKADEINLTYIVTNGYLETDTIWTIWKRTK